jgi:SAM-dependent methyltransferase
MRPIESWLSDDQLASIYSSAYWNDIGEEQKKELWIAGGDHRKCLDYLQQSRLLFEYQEAEKHVKSCAGSELKVADLAAGIGWTSALLSKLPNVGEVHAVEISKHRLGGLFEASAKMMGADETKLFRHFGSFYDLRFGDQSMDIIFLSQAFHHAQRPLALLTECDRVLKSGGRILLIGEHYIGWGKILKGFLRSLVKQRRLVTNFHELFPPDEKLGDHYYRRSDYYFMFGTMGYSLKCRILDAGKVIYIADKP